MAEFSLVYVRMWREDDEFRALDGDARLLFIWSFTNPDAAACGLYTASLVRMTESVAPAGVSRADLGPYEDRVEVALQALAAKPLVLYDWDHEVIWVPRRMSYANRSPQVRTLMRREYRQCPQSPLKTQFRSEYGDVLELPEEA